MELQKQVEDLTALVKPASSVSDTSLSEPGPSTLSALSHAAATSSRAEADSKKLCKAIDVYFPFINISLSKSKPLVQKVMLMILNIHDNTYQITQGREILREIVKRVYMDGEANIQILQAVLLYAAWGHLHVSVNPQLETLMRLAQALVEKMGFDRPPAGASIRHSNEELRTFLGVYYLGSKLSTPRRDGIARTRYNGHVARCCQELLDRPSDNVTVEEDARLVALVEIQRVVENFQDSISKDSAARTDKHTIFRKTLSTAIECSKEELQEIMLKLPEELSRGHEYVAEHDMLHMAYWHARMRLYEVTLNDETFSATDMTDDLDREDMLVRFSMAGEVYLSRYNLLPEEHYAAFPLHIWEDSQHAFINMVRCKKLPLSEREAANSTLALTLKDTFDREIRCLLGVQSLRRQNSQAYERTKDVFFALMNRTDRIMTWNASSAGENPTIKMGDGTQTANTTKASISVRNLSQPLWRDLVPDELKREKF